MIRSKRRALRFAVGRVLSTMSDRAAPAEAALDRAIDKLETLPVDGPWIVSRVRSWLIGAWFAMISVPLLAGYLADPENRSLDARLYILASRTWLEGGNPWAVNVNGIGYAAPPPSLIPTAVFTILPPPLDWQTLSIAVVAASLLTVRMLRLPWWWLMFPPAVQGMMAGNPQMLLIPLILRGGGWLAALLKIYAVVPIAVLRMRRQLMILAVVLVATAPFLPWALYVESWSAINASLSAQTGYGMTVTQSALLLLPAGLALVAIGRGRAAWLAVPALWPAQQWYYASLAMPVRSGLVGAIIALPITGSGAIALFALAFVDVMSRRRQHRLRTRASELPGTVT